MIQLEITITMGEDSKSMSLDEAQELYNMLEQVFKNKLNTNLNMDQLDKPIVKQEVKPTVTSQPKTTIRTNPRQSTKIAEKVKDKLSVEKALERARLRTAGCRGDTKSTSGCGS